jgi:O-6-methylguanine DNA methyltransferase
MIGVCCRKLDELWCAVAVEGERVFATNFGWDEQRVLRGLLESLPFNVPFQVVDKQSQLSERVLTAVRLMVAGKDVSVEGFKFEMAHLPKYSQRVLRFLIRVPVGYVTTYGALAELAGVAPRVVGRVMATNPFAPLIPCHRVVGSDFGLVGYGGGIKMKQAILQREDRDYKEPTKIKVDGSVLSVFPVGFVFGKTEI